MAWSSLPAASAAFAEARLSKPSFSTVGDGTEGTGIPGTGGADGFAFGTGTVGRAAAFAGGRAFSTLSGGSGTKT